MPITAPISPSSANSINVTKHPVRSLGSLSFIISRKPNQHELAEHRQEKNENL